MTNSHLLRGIGGHNRAERSFRYAPFIFGIVLMLLAVQATQAWASPTVSAATPSADATITLTSTVTTAHFSVHFVYPTSATPGQTEQILTNTTATSSADITRFSIDIFYINGRLLKLASQTVLADTTVRAGNTWQNSFTVNIPADAKPGPLIGTVTEIWRHLFTYYQSYYPQSYSYYNTYNAHPYNNYNNPQYARTSSGCNEHPSNNPQYARLSNGYNEYPNNNLQYFTYPNGFTVLVQTSQSQAQSQSQTQPYLDRSSHASRPATQHASNYPRPSYVVPPYPVHTMYYVAQITLQLSLTLTQIA